ncbi:MAG: hypothetical protein HPY53_13825 [Brevinematales bacterium]|nr:hypothetical protein [Brevinematales bacterium]
MKRVFASVMVTAMVIGALAGCGGGADWKSKMSRVEQLAAEMNVMLEKMMAGENIDETKADAMETEIDKIGEELDKIYPTLSEADKKEFDARKNAVEKLFDKY